MGEGRIFTASIDEHRVCALDVKDGSEVWSFTTGGRVDTPPTIHNGTALFGSRDGWVYCLRVSDGKLAWRLRAAPEERRIVAFGQLESAWPVHGAVLVKDNVAYAAAGRSTYLDGGIRVCALDPATGKLIRDMKPLNKRNPHGLADVLTSDGKTVFMRQLKYSLDGKPAGGKKKKKGKTGAGGPRAFSTGGLMDDSWFARVGWSVGRAARRGGCELLVFDENGQYGVFAYSKGGFGGMHTPGKKGYTVTALGKGAKKKWSRKVGIRPVAMVLAGDVLFAAGFTDKIDKDDPWAAFEGRKGGKLLALSAADGKPLAKYDLDAPPVYDGMSAAVGRLYISTMDGNVLCFAGK
jgi:outer membrane protein assembly factor BamB